MVRYNFTGMPERKVWSSEEDRILRLLVEERGLKRWSEISRIMEEEFQAGGRSGKQCRERYHNHLDAAITTAEWTPEQEELLFGLQDELGNKWRQIASRLPGRTDNCVKNHFYSKLRKSLRSLNKKINKFMKKEYRQIKTTTLYRVIQTLQSRNRTGAYDADAFQLSRKIKDHLYRYDPPDLADSQDLLLARTIIEDIALFDKDIRKKAALYSSARLSDGSRGKAVESTRSMIDEESQCSNSNQSLFSSSSLTHSLCSSHKLLPQPRLFRSQDIESEEEEDSGSDAPPNHALFRSTPSHHRPLSTSRLPTSPRLPPCSPRMPPIQQESAKRENSKHSQSSRSEGSVQEGHMFMLEESMEMKVPSPQQLTIRERMQMRQENDLLFYGEMEIQVQSSLARDFSHLGLSTPVLSSMPVLGKDTF